MIIDKGEKLVQWNKDSLLTNRARTTEHLLQINKSRHRPFTPFTKMSTEYITDMNVKFKIIKILE